jgi:membrane protein
MLRAQTEGMGVTSASQRKLDPEGMCTRVVARLIEEFACVCITPQSPAWRDIVLHGQPVGELRVYRGRGCVQRIVSFKFEAGTPTVRAHSIVVLTEPASPVPHLWLDSTHTGPQVSVSFDLLPKCDLGISLAYVDRCFGPLSQVLGDIAGHQSASILRGGADWLRNRRETGQRLLSEFLTEVPEGLGFGLGLTANLVVVLWTVQRASSGVITALNVVYDETEKRSRVRREAVALAIAAGVLVFLFLSLFLVAIVPLAAAALGDPLGPIVRFARWPLLALLFMLGLGLLYSFAPSRDRPHWQWISWGAVVATALWLAVSVLFSLYITHAADFGRFYGSLTAGVVLLTWLFISSFVIMVGAEINAQLAAVMAGDGGDGFKKTLDERERAPE